jgi:hypothetical protein
MISPPIVYQRDGRKAAGCGRRSARNGEAHIGGRAVSVKIAVGLRIYDGRPHIVKEQEIEEARRMLMSLIK